MKVVIITWVSGSWKSTLQQELLDRWFKRPNNFTTREIRWDYELDEYVFINEERYMFLLKEWAFLEHTNYNGNWYWVSSTLPDWNIAIVLDPVGRAQVQEKLARAWIECVTVFLDITPELQDERLSKRWDTEEDRKRRTNDFLWMLPTTKCRVYDWNLPANEIADDLCDYLKKI
jgi:guanylate kinase